MQSTPRASTNEAKYVRAAAHYAAYDRMIRRTTLTETDCLEWTGCINGNGYGAMTIDKQSVYAHRLMWWVVRGPIEPGMVVDHLCHNRRCLNVAHMRIATVIENGRNQPRSFMLECGKGHPLTGENVNMSDDSASRGHRQCRECNRSRSKAYHLANK